VNAVFTAYIALHLAIGGATAALLLTARYRPALSARSLAGLHYAAAMLAIAAALLAPWLPAGFVSTPDISSAGKLLHDTLADAMPRADGSAFTSTWLPAADDLAAWAIGLSMVAGAWVAAGHARDACRLRSLRRRAQLVRSHGRVRIWVCADAISPFSFRGLRHAHVFIPQLVVARREWYRLSIAHELQHHRQADTSWLHLFGALRVACAMNPFAWLWSAELARVQELACDENVLARRRWPVADYARGLFDVARAVAPQRGLAGATLLVQRNTLKRRIEEMMNPDKVPLRGPLRTVLYIGLLATLTFTAAAASSLTGAAAGPSVARSAGVLPIRIGAVAAAFEIPEEGATRRPHGGADIAAPAGTPVYAWQDGVVIHAGERKGCGVTVVLQHGQGTRSTYCNLAGLAVTAGDTVKRDQALGKLADLGTAKKAHLHFEIQVDGRNVDPARQVDLLALR
jgi:beta-lactamase regulating signal transducer with metallopeptidase domain